MYKHVFINIGIYINSIYLYIPYIIIICRFLCFFSLMLKNEKSLGYSDYLSKIMPMFASRLVVTQRIRYENRIKRLLQERLSLSISL